MLDNLWRRTQRPRADNWKMWLLLRSRPLVFALAMGLVLIFLLVFGENG